VRKRGQCRPGEAISPYDHILAMEGTYIDPLTQAAPFADGPQCAAGWTVVLQRPPRAGGPSRGATAGRRRRESGSPGFRCRMPPGSRDSRSARPSPPGAGSAW
jgi:hypothetical protein